MRVGRGDEGRPEHPLLGKVGGIFRLAGNLAAAVDARLVFDQDRRRRTGGRSRRFRRRRHRRSFDVIGRNLRARLHLSHDHAGNERTPDAGRTRDALRRADAPLLDPDRAVRAAAREPGPQGADPRRGPGALSRSLERARPHRRPLSAPARRSAVRHSRRVRAALPVPRLALRRDRNVHRAAARSAAEARDRAEARRLSGARARRPGVRLHGPAAGAGAAALGPLRAGRTRSGRSPSTCSTATGCSAKRTPAIRCTACGCTATIFEYELERNDQLERAQANDHTIHRA